MARKRKVTKRAAYRYAKARAKRASKKSYALGVRASKATTKPRSTTRRAKTEFVGWYKRAPKKD